MRAANRILAVAVALGLAVGGFLVAVEIGFAAIGADPLVLPWDDWYAQARANRWDSAGTRLLSLALLVAGVTIVGLQLVHGRPRSVALPAGEATAGVARRSLEDAVATAAAAEDGVSGARASIRGSRVAVRTTTRRAQGDLSPRIEAAARGQLQAAGLEDDLAVSVHVDRHKN